MRIQRRNTFAPAIMILYFTNLLLFTNCLPKAHLTISNETNSDNNETNSGNPKVKDEGTEETAANMTSSLTQYGITWTFSEPVQYGQFVTGDYWVLDSGHGITVTSVSPAPANGQNGSMLNPIPGVAQGFDIEAENYSMTKAVVFPVVLHSRDSLLSSISLDGTENRDWSGDNIGSHEQLRSVSVLSVLATEPPSGSFRPSYSDRTQTLYNISAIRLDVLPNRISPSNLPSHSGFTTLGYFERGTERPWILFGRGWQSRAIHPTEAMYDYHQDVGFFLSELTLLLTTDIADKTTLLYRFIQIGIDYYYCNAVDSSTWAWPVVFTGLLLDNADMYNFWINNPTIRNGREHEKLYYIGDVVESTTSSIIPEGKTWVDWTTMDGKYVAFRKQAGEEYEHLHPSEWTCFSPHCKAEIYRAQHDVYPLIGMILSSIIVDNLLVDKNVNNMLAHPPYRDYCDRWMTDGFQTNMYANTGRTYRQEMEHYRTFTIYNYLYGSGGSDFIDEMWIKNRRN